MCYAAAEPGPVMVFGAPCHILGFLPPAGHWREECCDLARSGGIHERVRKQACGQATVAGGSRSLSTAGDGRCQCDYRR